MKGKRKMKVKSVMMAVAGLFMSTAAFAEEAAHAAATAAASTGAMDLAGLGAGLGLGLAALGGALGQGKTAASALEGISRNPAASDKVFTPMIIGLALIESLVLYAFVIAFLKIK
jgi:F-type H+-transporting ATPase subunit c